MSKSPEVAEWSLESIMPTLEVDDLDRATAFYAKLGFQSTWRYGDPPTHAGLAATSGGADLMLALHDDASGPIQRQNFYLFARGVDALYESVRDALGADATGRLTELTNADYGMRDFGVTDPWGHRLTFGEPSERLAGDGDASSPDAIK
ncbi:MAG: glyoxalase superfamily protein [Phycisphaerales bacterium]